MREVDVLVVGGGLAGCAVAWQAMQRGLNVMVIDSPRPDSSSRVAAGLVTPITGWRLAVTWHWDEFYGFADTFYREVEVLCGERLWHVEPSWRLFIDTFESERFSTRWQSDVGQTLLGKSGVTLRALTADEARVSMDDFGGMAMAPVARLDVPHFVERTRAKLQAEDCWIETELDCDHDLSPHAMRMDVPRLGLTSRWLILAQGIEARRNQWFRDMPLHPARGDILEIEDAQVGYTRVMHHVAWAVPLGEQRYLVGATYDRQCHDTDLRSVAGRSYRDELIDRWQTMTGSAGRILEQRAGIRPASYDRHPLVGPHPAFPRMLCLNGLGSKGSLMAPKLASEILDFLQFGTQIHPAYRWDRKIIESKRRSERGRRSL